MARAAVLGRLTWLAATVAQVRPETATARTLVLDVPGWTGHEPGQHVDVRLTAEDGYMAQRSYSVASAPSPGQLELTVQLVDDGEVSPYLVEIAQPGDAFELRGPVGGYFTRAIDDPAPVLLVAGGSGVVPLMSMIRARADAMDATPFRLIYSVRAPQQAIYAEELAACARADVGLDVVYTYTRQTPPGWPRPPSRLDAATLAEHAWPTVDGPACFVCGPTDFVETVADLLVRQGNPATRVKTERFG